MTADFDVARHLRQIAEAVQRDLAAVNLFPWAPSWVFHCYRPVRSKSGQSYAELRAVTGAGPSAPEIVKMDDVDWSDQQLSYHVEVLAQPLGLFPTLPPGSVRYGSPHDETAEATATLAIRRARAVHPDSAVFAQMEWHPGWAAPGYSYGGVRPGARKGENSTVIADTGLELLAVFQRPREPSHRPPGSHDIESAEEYAQLIYTNIYSKSERDRGLKDAPAATIAAWLGISESSIDRYRTVHGIGIRDIRRHRVQRPGPN